jgi:hypothetical protein
LNDGYYGIDDRGQAARGVGWHLCFLLDGVRCHVVPRKRTLRAPDVDADHGRHARSISKDSDNGKADRLREGKANL